MYPKIRHLVLFRLDKAKFFLRRIESRITELSLLND